MWIRKAVDWLFGLGDGCEVADRKPLRSPNQRPSEVTEVRLYGEAEAIRVLYQVAFLDASPPKPPRPRGRRGVWIARYLSPLSPVLRQLTAGAKA
ncbi:MAG TPA: hypothetical protein VFG23_19870 [Polyangia bacterium]|nr:hypothetical protein [Polyangia bacterium]